MKRCLWLFASAVLALGAPAFAHAQDGEPAAATPSGPAEIVGQAGKARAEREMKAAAERAAGTTPEQAAPSEAPAQAAPTEAPAQAAPAQAAPAQSPHGDNPHAGVSPHGGGGPHGGMDLAAAPKPIHEERADPSLPVGTLRVRVVDSSEQPVANAEVVLGIMGADSQRSSKPAVTDAQGVFEFRDLATGEKHAYRVNVPYEGAKYSSNPFRLPPRGGYEVLVRRMPVTRDARTVVLYMGATSLELKEERVQVIQQARVLNLGRSTYVFPQEGTLVALPPDFLNVQTQESMGDQHVTEAKGEGLRVTGSIPPGETSLMWGFDLPLHGEELTFSTGLPWLTFSYRVIADAPEGLQLSVDGMPETFLHNEAGRRFLITEMQRKVGETPFERLSITLRGIPGPGPARWIATALAIGLVLGGLLIMRRPPKAQDDKAHAQRELEEQRAEIAARVRTLDEELAKGAIGPEYHKEQREAAVDELAHLLFERAGTAS
jgi:hypothetical protein